MMKDDETSLSRMSQILNTFERVKFERRPQKEACMSLFMRAEWAGQWRKGGRKFTPFHTQIHPLRGNKKIQGKKYCFRFLGKKQIHPLSYTNSSTQRQQENTEQKNTVSVIWTKTNSPPFIPKQISVLN